MRYNPVHQTNQFFFRLTSEFWEFVNICLQLIADEHAERDKRLIAMDKRLQDLKKERGLLQRESHFLKIFD